ncbi:MAG: DUF3604 domain-containing protein [bacterium]|nr:DUF3604 domain-containing protein [bacterium]
MPLSLPYGFVVLALLGLALASPSRALADSKVLLWGDTHLHTSNSFDAYLNRNMSADPDTAYRFARGLPVIHPFHRARVQIDTPLDFLVVADHAELLGSMRHIVERGIPREGLGWQQRFRAFLAERWIRGVVEEDEGSSAFNSFLPDTNSVEEALANPRQGGLPNSDLMAKNTWREATRIADAHNTPGTFTTLIGWEWSSIPAGANLHRVVFTNATASVAETFMPWSSLDSPYPEDLWGWLENTSEQTGAEFVAIPHNSNISKGHMFAEKSLRGAEMTPEYARLRARWEPAVEATQIKGDSETHPKLSPRDPFADFETYPHYIQQTPPPYDPQAGDYVRSALIRGLKIEERIGFNPYRFGLIGSTDSHTGMASPEEPNFWGKLARDSIPENKRDTRRGLNGPSGWSMSASGLAAVWSKENTRDAIVDAFKRKEIYATTGPRITVRVFAGYDFRKSDLRADPGKIGYKRGVPMGGLLVRAKRGQVPRFLVHASMDMTGANLDRVQMVKGWTDERGGHERVYDIAWSGKRKLDAAGTLPLVGNSVDFETASYRNDIGSPELSTVWKDPDFDPDQRAFYYVRVLEIPTPRHSSFDALALGLKPTEIKPPWSIQERAYTSPIWYTP